MATAHTPSYYEGRSWTARAAGHPLQTASAVLGIVFLLVGIAGFIPGVTTNYDDLMAAGTDSDAELLGLFQVSALHNVVHLAFGVAGLIAARTATASKVFLIGGGILYLVLTLYGSVIDLTSDWNFIPLNTADNWLHLGLGVGMVLIGAVLLPVDRPEETGRRRTPTTR